MDHINDFIKKLQIKIISNSNIPLSTAPPINSHSRKFKGLTVPYPVRKIT